MESFFKTFTYGQGNNGALGKKAQTRKQGLLSSVYYVPVPSSKYFIKSFNSHTNSGVGL